MYKFAVIILFLVICNINAQVNEARNLFPNVENSEQADKVLEELKVDTTAEGYGYTAAMLFMKSRFVKGPFSKLKFFNKGKDLLDETIAENKGNLELRYIRYLMQMQIPGFLGYKDNLEEDFNLFAQNIVGSSNFEPEFKLQMISYMLLVEKLSDAEKEILTNLKSQL